MRFVALRNTFPTQPFACLSVKNPLRNKAYTTYSNGTTEPPGARLGAGCRPERRSERATRRVGGRLCNTPAPPKYGERVVGITPHSRQAHRLMYYSLLNSNIHTNEKRTEENGREEGEERGNSVLIVGDDEHEGAGVGARCGRVAGDAGHGRRDGRGT